MDDLYFKLREWMHHVTPMGFRETGDGSEIELLKYLFTPEKGRLALQLSIDLKPLDTIAESAGMSPEQAERILDQLYVEGVIRRKTDDAGKQYAALAFIPGMMENLVFTRTTEKELVRLVRLVFQANMLPSFNDQTGITRTVPVEMAIPSGSESAPYQDIVQMIKKAERPIVVMPCHCRVHKEDRCNAPLEVCMAFGDYAQYYLDNGVVGREIDEAEALKIVKTAGDAGLVHSFINYSEDELSWLCNCCRCCCINMSVSNQMFPTGKVRNVDPSAYIAHIMADECSGCGVCIDRCPVHALALEDDIAVLNEERCIGCGVCVEPCPTGAIRLSKRPEDRIPKIPKTWRELIDRQHAAYQRTHKA